MNQVITSYCTIRSMQVRVNGQSGFHDENFITFAEFIKALYKHEGLSYPKFYKMDALCKLGFMAAELTLKHRAIGLYHAEDIGIVLSNNSASMDTDLIYQESISDRFSYFPSPSVFVYTLPNIMIGEISIRHKIKGENAFLIADTFDSRLLHTYVSELFRHQRVKACLTGWVDLMKDHADAMVMLVEQADAVSGTNEHLPVPFTEMKINELYNSI